MSHLAPLPNLPCVRITAGRKPSRLFSPKGEGRRAAPSHASLAAAALRRVGRAWELALVLVLVLVARAVERDGRVGLLALAVAAPGDALAVVRVN